MYDKNFGGAITTTPEQFEKMNGFSNLFWGWGGEDDDFWNRLVDFWNRLVETLNKIQ